jgi:hypothetical protein
MRVRSRLCWRLPVTGEPARPWSSCWRWPTDRTCEAELAEALEADVDAGRLPDLAFLRAYFGPGPASVPLIDVKVAPLSAYDELVAIATVTTTPALQVAA